MEEKEIEVTLLEIKNLYEYFYGAYNRPGLSVDWSLLVAKNIKYLETHTIRLVKVSTMKKMIRNFMNSRTNTRNLLGNLQIVMNREI